MDCFQRAAGKHFIELSEHKYSCDNDVDDDDDDDDEIGNNYWIRPEHTSKGNDKFENMEICSHRNFN